MSRVTKMVFCILMMAALVTTGFGKAELTADIEGEDINLSDHGAFIKDDGVPFVPVRIIGEKLGAYVHWEQDEQKVYIYPEDKGRFIELELEAAEFIINGETQAMSSSSQLRNNRIQVPLHFINDALEARASWDGNKVSIAQGGEQNPKVEMDTLDEEFEASEDIAFKIKNRGNTELTFARIFKVEYFHEEQNSWEEVELELAWIQDMVMLKPGENHIQKINPEDFAQETKTGSYRILKEVRCFETDQEFLLTEEFQLN
ncbi:copper amine oxidase N-terminal domain-containing protein [Natranaerobius thermophilus]|uniref:Copper amine oxidase domain protein n=1 Tax=Natranaerobius thermophilus (strain ATCC BAA-1301 / DSM 18059 / JW/NM-WN-LF) TaxID=457570 RepID=B2A7F5_NATTJ|nr:copper amine oxidase N-terminal domain-containing protein [Natranaerobius thermophilus]ACB85664.1 copper amine oxidase domain protein [Natranaerobius thermophilus JW/NM-WN-LF]